MDVVRGEEVPAIACSEELVDPRAHRVGSHRSDVEGVLAGFGEEGLDGLCCFLRTHFRGEAHVGEIGLVEGEHPRRRVRTVDQVDRFRNIARKGHHGNVILSCTIRAYAVTGQRRLEGEPLLRGGNLVVHGELHAAVEANALDRSAAARTC